MAFLESVLVDITGSLFSKGIEKLLNSPHYPSPSIIAPHRYVLNDSFFEPYYQNAVSIQNMGIALSQMINHLSQIKKGVSSLSKTHLVSNLKRRNLNVKLLLMDPDSKYIKERMELENNFHLREDIQNSLNRLEELKQYLQNLASQDRIIYGSLEVRLLDDRVPFAYFNAKPMSIHKPAVCYLGLILPGLRGDQCPQICIRDKAEQSDLYDVVNQQFFSLYTHNTRPVFTWEEDVVR